MTGGTSLQRRTILAVEDEMLPAVLLEDIRENAGHKVIRAGHLEQATLLDRIKYINAAVLNVNLRLLELYPGRTVITKPYKDTDLIAALAAVISAVSSIR